MFGQNRRENGLKLHISRPHLNYSIPTLLWTLSLNELRSTKRVERNRNETVRKTKTYPFLG